MQEAVEAEVREERTNEASVVGGAAAEGVSDRARNGEFDRLACRSLQLLLRLRRPCDPLSQPAA